MHPPYPYPSLFSAPALALSLVVMLLGCGGAHPARPFCAQLPHDDGMEGLVIAAAAQAGCEQDRMRDRNGVRFYCVDARGHGINIRYRWERTLCPQGEAEVEVDCNETQDQCNATHARIMRALRELDARRVNGS